MSEQAEKDPAQVLEDAADLLLIRGRCKGDLRGEDGTFCVVGAIGEVVGIGPTHYSCGYDHPAVQAIADHLGVKARPDLSNPFCGVLNRGLRVGDWNDSTEDDFEVIDTLRHVAKDLRNEAKP